MNIKIGENTYGQVVNDKASGMDAGVYSKEDLKGTTVVNMSDAVSFSKGKNDKIIKGETVEEIQSLASVTDVTMQKNSMTVMAHSMSDKDFARMREEGHDISDMDPEQVVTISDEIKAEMAKSGQVIDGYNDDLDKEVLEEVTGSIAYAQAIEASFAKEDIPANKENVEKAASAIDMAASFQPLDTSTKLYMAENHLEPTIENIYKASHSGVANKTGAGTTYYADNSGYIGKASGEDIDDEQIRKALEKMGVSDDEENLKLASDLVRNNIPLNEKSFDIYKKLDELKLPMDVQDIADKVSMAIKHGKNEMQADLSENEDMLDKAVRLVKELDDISDEAVESVAAKGEKLNLRNLKAESARLVRITTMQASVSMTSLSSTINGNGYSASRMMAEVRLSMTVSSTYVLLKNDIDVDTTDLKQLVEELKEAENRQFESVFGKEYSVDKQALKDLYNETNDKTNALRNMPLETVGVLASRSSYTLNIAYSEAKIIEARYANASNRYETMSTQVRTDLGDSMNKAFAGIAETLDEMGLEHTELNEKAVRILGYNQMAVNESSIEKVKTEYQRLNNVLDQLRPGKVLSLIREGVNPLEISMDELFEKLNKMDDDNEPKRFSKYLNDLERAGNITESEKQGYIGIYRLIHHIEKNDSAALGMLINNGAEINFKNLLSAVRSRKHAGMDITIDDKSGAIENLINKGVSISEQIGKAYIKIEGQEEDYNSDYYKNENDILRQAALLDTEVSEQLEKAGERVTSQNLLTFDKLINQKTNIYDKARKYDERNEEKSLSNVFDGLLDKITDKETAEKAYKDMLEASKEVINDQASLVETSNDDQWNILTDMTEIVNMLEMSNRLSRHQYYKVPSYINGELLDINVMIKEGSKKGVSISFESAEYGMISASFDNKGQDIFGNILTESEKAKDILEKSKDRILSAFEDNGIAVKAVNIMNSRKISLNIFDAYADNINIEESSLSQGRDDEISTDAISTKAYYNIARIFIKEMTAI